MEIHVLCPGAVQDIAPDLAQEFTERSATSVRFTYGTAGGLQAKAVGGESGDVIIVTSKGIEDLIAKGIVRAGSQAELGKVGVGLAVKTGAPMPDISTAQALRKILLAAKSLSYADPASGAQSAIHFVRVLDKLGLTEILKNRSHIFPGGPVGLQKVATGEIEIGIAQVSEIVNFKGVSLVGPFPEELQNSLTFSAGILAKAASPEIAREFIRYLTSPEGRKKFRSGGFETP